MSVNRCNRAITTSSHASCLLAATGSSAQEKASAQKKLGCACEGSAVFIYGCEQCPPRTGWGSRCAINDNDNDCEVPPAHVVRYGHARSLAWLEKNPEVTRLLVCAVSSSLASRWRVTSSGEQSHLDVHMPSSRSSGRAEGLSGRATQWLERSSGQPGHAVHRCRRSRSRRARKRVNRGKPILRLTFEWEWEGPPTVAPATLQLGRTPYIASNAARCQSLSA
jgi:hypothetical protein